MKPDIACLIVPITTGSLIFPQNMLAEVLVADKVGASSNPNIIGWMEWSRRSVPVVDFENLCDPSHDKRPIHRVVVMHTALGDERLPFVALQAEGIPHSVTINESILLEQDVEISCPYVARHLLVSNLPCILADWPSIEELVLGI